MMQRYSLLSMSLLTVSAIIVAAMSIDPKGFALKDWQPLMAALVALGGAAVVWQSAQLTYRAAMSRVQLDERTAEREDARKKIGLLLRFDHALHILSYEIARCIEDMEKHRALETLHERIDTAKASPSTALDQIWNNLELFPISVAAQISYVQVAIYNVTELQRDAGDEVLNGNQFTPKNKQLVVFMRELETVALNAKKEVTTHRLTITGS